MKRSIQHFSSRGLNQQQYWFTAASDFQRNFEGNCSASDKIVASSAPYAIDFTAERIINVVYNSPEELRKATFLHQQQKTSAQQLVSIPFEELHNISENIFKISANQLEPTFIFSIGRTGSTLLAKIFEALGIPSLSEPDVLTHYSIMQAQRETDIPGTTENIQEIILHTTTGLLHASGALNTAIKFRSQTNAIAEKIMAAAPKANGIMILRDGKSWAKSIHRAFSWSPAETAANMALAHRAVDRCKKSGRPLTILRYEDLSERPLDTAKKLAQTLNLPGLDIDEDKLSQVMSTDSQKDTDLAMDKIKNKEIPPSFIPEYKKEWIKQKKALKSAGIEILV